MKGNRARAKRLWLAAEAVCVIVFVMAAGALAVRIINARARVAEERAAREMLSDARAPETGALMTDKGRELIALNPDAAGMVGFADMSLYVCKADDNYYYARHRFDGSEDPAGMIFMDCRCSIWPLSHNTVLYGHNMKDGSRFGKLKRYERPEYLALNPVIRLASLYEIIDFEPIAVFHTTVDESSANYFDFAQIDFADEAAFDAYISAVKQRSLYAIPADVQYEDRLLTLATCTSDYDGGRTVIVCRESAQAGG